MDDFERGTEPVGDSWPDTPPWLGPEDGPAGGPPAWPPPGTWPASPAWPPPGTWPAPPAAGPSQPWAAPPSGPPGAWPPPSGTFGSGPAHEAPPRPPSRRRGLGILAAGLALAIGAASVGAGIGAALARARTPSTLPATSALLPGSGGVNGAVTAKDSAIAAKVDPGVVDVMTRLGFQGGSAAGTGMVVSADGKVLTNNHVIDGATAITVRIAGTGPTYTATVVGTDPTEDVALLQVKGAAGLTTIPLGDSSKTSAGDRVVAIGNALGLGGPPSVSAGTIAAVNQSITASDTGGANAENLTGLLQTDAQLRPGDSGGPLVNTAAKVVGMDTAAASSGRFSSATPVGFAIPVNRAMAIVHQMEAGRASATIHLGASAFLGVQIQPAGQTGPGSGSVTSGAVIAGVEPNTPAESAGLGGGDTIVAIDGQSIASPAGLTQAIGSHHPNDKVKVTWLDPSGQSHSATVKLGTGPAN